jgi:hypothetical protein
MEDSWFMDDILGEPYKDPVMAEDGFIYERSFIENWFNTGSTKSPKTLLPIGTSLFYPFEYYQARSAWVKSKGLPEPKKPEQYGLIGGKRPVRAHDRTSLEGHASSSPVRPVSINYYYVDEIYEEEGYLNQGEYPPLPPPSPPTRSTRRR